MKERNKKHSGTGVPRQMTLAACLILLLAGLSIWWLGRGTAPRSDDSGSSASSQSGGGADPSAPDGSAVVPQEPQVPDSSGEVDPGNAASQEETPPAPGSAVGESAAVDASWYDDAVFLGDSRMDGFHLYAGPSGATYFAETGAKAKSIAEKDTERLADGSKVPILQALEGKTFSKIYLNIGMNDLGDYDIQRDFIDAYAAAIDRIREIQPDCDIYLMTLFPVTAEQDAKGSYVNNKAIVDLNSCIRYLASQKGAYLLEVDSIFTGSDGCLPAEDSFDGIHLTPDACKLWRQYLDTHTVS